MTPDEERYRWLRDGKTIYGGYGGHAPFVWSPKSRLYAVYSLRAANLDASVDADILHNKMHSLHIANELVERGLLPVGVVKSDFSDEAYCTALQKLAQTELDWDNERTKNADDYDRYGSL